MKVIVLHDARGEIQSFGVVGETIGGTLKAVRAGMVVPAGLYASEIELSERDFPNREIPHDFAKVHRVNRRGGECVLERIK